MKFPAFFDTNVLFGSHLNDFILRLAERGAFRPLWSEEVLEELQRNLVARFDPSSIERRIKFMREAFPDSLVEGYEQLTGQMTCEPKDRHVLAAAVRANAEVLVTFNIQDFPPTSVESFEVEIVHPDDFLLDQLDLFPGLVLGTLRQWSDDYVNPPRTQVQLLQSLARSGVPRFATHVLQRYLDG